MTTKLNNAFAQLHQQGFQKRQAQLDMSQTIAHALQHNQIAIIEGGTGVGKSFGYLLPTLLTLPPGKTLVIATATVALQQQLLETDIPRIKSLLPDDMTIEMAKGRRRYVCLARLHECATQQTQGDLALFGVITPLKKTEKPQIKRLFKDYTEQRWQGDRDSLDTEVDDELWLKLTTDAAGCSNRKCQFFRDCAYFHAKKRLQKAQVIITNQDLLLADISFGTGVLLPKQEDCIYVIDEAHHLPEKAIQHFAAQTTLLGHISWLDRVMRTVGQVQTELKLTEAHLAQLTNEVDNVKQALQSLHTAIENPMAQQDTWVLFSVPAELNTLAMDLSRSAAQLYERLTGLRQQLTENHDARTLTQYERLLGAIGLYTQRAQQIWQTFHLFTQKPAPSEAPIARWFDNARAQKATQDFQCHVAFTRATHCLQSQFWQRTQNAVILCSATLRSLGQFNTYIDSVGLQNDPRVVTKAHASPFPYEASELRIANLPVKPEGADQTTFQQAVLEKLPPLLNTETLGTLVLFTNRAAMEQTYRQLPSTLKTRILMQNAYPKQRIIDMHKKCVNQGKPSVIFGLQSFAEGIDLPGQYCEHLIITKLPFSVPNTPIAQVYQRWLTQRGENAFYQYSLPHASLRLTQFVGRLIRQESDKGRVTILDRRLIEKSYGTQLIANLPPFTLVDEAKST